MQYAPELGGTMYFAWMNGSGWFTWLFNAKTRTWTDLNPTGLENAPSVPNYVSEGFRSVLSWDNANNVMLLHIPTFGIYVYNAPANRWDKVAETNPQRTLTSQMFDYDDEHNVHVMASYNYSYDQDIWAFRYARTQTPVEATPAKAVRSGLGLLCSPNPMHKSAVVTFNLANASNVRLALYDIRGRLHKTLVNDTRTSGGHSVILSKGGIPAGHYVLKLTAGRQSASRNVLIEQ
jgi:hypothetical protein